MCLCNRIRVNRQLEREREREREREELGCAFVTDYGLTRHSHLY